MHKIQKQNPQPIQLINQNMETVIQTAAASMFILASIWLVLRVSRGLLKDLEGLGLQQSNPQRSFYSIRFSHLTDHVTHCNKRKAFHKTPSGGFLFAELPIGKDLDFFTSRGKAVECFIFLMTDGFRNTCTFYTLLITQCIEGIFLLKIQIKNAVKRC